MLPGGPPVSAGTIIAAIEAVGFDASEAANESPPKPWQRRAMLRIEGMSCASCSTAVQGALRDERGVLSAR